jgi:ATP-dependent DNA helicase RecQ
MWLDRSGALSEATPELGAGLRLFGLTKFRDGQLAVIQAALKNQSVLVVSPTGFGKTLCFQLPAVLRRQMSIVVSPLKALMGEQVSALLRKKIPATVINSDLDQNEKMIRYELLTKNAFKLLYAAPERFFVKSKRELQILHSTKPVFLVIDEAHCVDQWGRDFRPEYGQLAHLLFWRLRPQQGWRCNGGF